LIFFILKKWKKWKNTKNHKKLIIFFKYVLLKTLTTIYFELIEMDPITEQNEELSEENKNIIKRFLYGFYSTAFNKENTYCSEINPKVNGESFMLGLNLQRRNGRHCLIKYFGEFFDPKVWKAYSKGLLNIINNLKKSS
jgi:hypothetical protein